MACLRCKKSITKNENTVYLTVTSRDTNAPEIPDTTRHYRMHATCPTEEKP